MPSVEHQVLATKNQELIRNNVIDKNVIKIIIKFTIFFSLVSESISKEEDDLPAITCNLKSRRVLKGHRGRVLHFDWSMDKTSILSAGQVRMRTPSKAHAATNATCKICGAKCSWLFRVWLSS